MRCPGSAPPGTDWLFAGGRAALESYGIDPGGPRELWASLVPQTHQAFLRDLILMHREGGYAFVHAGVRPGSLGNQTRDDLLRSRQPFLYSEAEFRRRNRARPHAGEGAVVRHNRIAIDTGAVFGGPAQLASCLRLTAWGS